MVKTYPTVTVPIDIHIASGIFLQKKKKRFERVKIKTYICLCYYYWVMLSGSVRHTTSVGSARHTESMLRQEATFLREGL